MPRGSSGSLVSASDSALWTTSTSRGRVRGVFRGVRGRFQRGRALGTTAGLLLGQVLFYLYFIRICGLCWWSLAMDIDAGFIFWRGLDVVENNFELKRFHLHILLLICAKLFCSWVSQSSK